MPNPANEIKFNKGAIALTREFMRVTGCKSLTHAFVAIPKIMNVLLEEEKKGNILLSSKTKSPITMESILHDARWNTDFDVAKTESLNSVQFHERVRDEIVFEVVELFEILNKNYKLSGVESFLDAYVIAAIAAMNMLNADIPRYKPSFELEFKRPDNKVFGYAFSLGK